MRQGNPIDLSQAQLRVLTSARFWRFECTADEARYCYPPELIRLVKDILFDQLVCSVLDITKAFLIDSGGWRALLQSTSDEVMTKEQNVAMHEKYPAMIDFHHASTDLSLTTRLELFKQLDKLCEPKCHLPCSTFKVLAEVMQQGIMVWDQFTGRLVLMGNEFMGSYSMKLPTTRRYIMCCTAEQITSVRKTQKLSSLRTRRIITRIGPTTMNDLPFSQSI